MTVYTRIWLSALILVSQHEFDFRFLGFTFPPLIWLSLSIFYPLYPQLTPLAGSVLFLPKFESFCWDFIILLGFDSPGHILNPRSISVHLFQILIFLLGFDCLYSDMTICPDFGLPARIWFSLPGFYFPSPDLTLAIHILPSLPAVDSTCWKCTLPAQIWALSAEISLFCSDLTLPALFWIHLHRMYFSLQDFNKCSFFAARIWLFILGYDYLPWFWSPSTNLIFASWVLLSLPWFDSRYPYFTLFTRSWLHLLEVYSSCPNLSLSAEISLFCSDLTLPALFWIHLPDVFLPSRF